MRNPRIASPAEESVKHQAHLAGIPDSLIFIDIVEQRMNLSGRSGEIPHLRHPLLQFIIRVKMIESLLYSNPFLLPVHYLGIYVASSPLDSIEAIKVYLVCR